MQVRSAGRSICAVELMLAIALAFAVTPARSADDVAGQAQSAGQSAAQERFDVFEYRVLGNSVLKSADIERILYSHLGPGKNLDDVEQARKALEEGYRNAGYGAVFVDIPEQDVDDGIVRLRATEGKIDRVRIAGARYFANGQIREQLPSLERGAVLSLPSFQTQLAAVNRRSRDRQVTPVLKAGRTPGTVDIELRVKDELPVHGSVEVNNRYTASTSKLRANLNLSYDNLFQRYHSLALQYQTAPEEPDEARVIAATYVAPLTRGILALYAVDTDSEVATIGTLGVIGKGRIYGTRYIIPLPEASGLFHNFTLGGDFKDFDEDVQVSADTGLQTPIQYVNWSLAYAGGYRTAHTASNFNIGANFGIRGLGNDPEEFENKRFLARPDYYYLSAGLDHERPLLFGTRIAVRLAGQFTAEPLISNEQFSIGGADSVRGYLESEQLGDYGLNASAEIRSPFLGAWAPQLIQSLYLFSFYDAGIVQILEPLPQQERSVDLSSWGVGLRLAGFGGLEADLDWAYPLDSSGNVEAGDSRIHFRVRYGF